MNDTIAPRLRTILATIASKNDTDISGEDRLVEDLGLNSMSLIELSIKLESEFDLGMVDDTQSTNLVTVGDLENLIRTAQSSDTRTA